MKPKGKRRKRSKPGSPEEWLAHAESDLNLARLGKDRDDILPEQVCFHAQQAAEKGLKAVLLHRKIEFPFIHDIEALLEIMTQSGLVVPPDVADAGALTPYAVEARYPGYEEEITPSQVAEAIRLAERVVSWVLDVVAGHEKLP
jgi:HEPN domain-containing protein